MVQLEVPFVRAHHRQVPGETRAADPVAGSSGTPIPARTTHVIVSSGGSGSAANTKISDAQYRFEVAPISPRARAHATPRRTSRRESGETAIRHDTGRGRSRPATKSSTSSERMSASNPRTAEAPHVRNFATENCDCTGTPPAVSPCVNGSNAFFEHELNFVVFRRHRARCTSTWAVPTVGCPANGLRRLA